MNPRVIRDEGDYAAALGRIEELMDAEPGTAEADELDVWVTLVEVYENKEHPIDAPDPIDAIRFRMEQGGLRQADLAPLLGGRSRVSEILARKRPLTLNMIRALNEQLGIPLQSLIGKPTRKHETDAVSLDAGSFPIGEMAKRGWFPSFQGSARDAKVRSSELISDWLSGIQTTRLRAALARQHVRAGAQSDDWALLAWKLRILWLAERETIPPYIPGTIDEKFGRELVSLSYLEEGPRLAREFLRKSGIHLITERQLPHTYLDGMATVSGRGAPVISLTLRHDRIDNFWFTLLHELAHLLLHIEDAQVDEFMDDLDASSSESVEMEADQWAQEILIPSGAWERAQLSVRPRPETVRRVASELRVHPAIVAGRVRRERSDYRILSKLVGQGKVRVLLEENQAA